jgi:hypothetical protein
MGKGMDDAKVDYRKILFHLQNTGENLLGENVNEMKLFPNALQKFLIPYWLY